MADGRNADLLWGTLAEYPDPDGVVRALHRLHRAGYRRFDAYTPFPVLAVNDAVRRGRSSIGVIAFAGAAVGLAVSLGLQWYLSAVDYPINVGGRPLAAWTAFSLPAIEAMILAGAAAGVFGLLALCRLPRFHHPLFDVERFGGVDGGRFFVAVERRDPRFDREDLHRLLRAEGATWVGDVSR